MSHLGTFVGLDPMLWGLSDPRRRPGMAFSARFVRQLLHKPVLLEEEMVAETPHSWDDFAAMKPKEERE